MILPVGAVIDVPKPIPPDYAETAVVSDPTLRQLFAILNGTENPPVPAPRYTGYRNNAATLTADYEAADYEAADYHTG